jgi:gliding-associated putative ABC transporter substrate-binding component GldG
MGKMKRGQLRTGSTILVLIVLGILAAVNIIAQRYFFRLDLTEDKRYSIAPATRAVLERMDDVVNVDAYFSRNLPPYLANLRRQVEDTLAEYRAYSGGRLSVQFKDPGSDPVTQQRLRSLGIPEVQLEILEEDQFRLTTAYLGIALHYGGRKEVLPVVQSVGRLEYELTSAILRLTTPERKGLGWLAGSREEISLQGGGSPLRGELGRLYDIRDLSPEDLREVPPEVQTVIVEGPEGLPEEARFALDQFLMRGGSAVFLIDHFSIPEGGIFPVPMESGVHDLLEHYGVRVNRDVLVEPFYNAQVSFSSGFMQFRIPYPYWPRVPRDLLGREHPVTAGLESIVLPWASSLEVLADEGSGVRAEVLASSSPSSWTVSGQYDFSPQKRVSPPMSKDERGERPLAVLLQGSFRSFWAEKEPPPAGEEAAPPEVVGESPETSILVLGTSRPAQTEFLRQFPENAVFLMNAVDWMTFGPDLIGIRSRTSGERTLPELPRRTKTILKVGNVVIVPALLGLFGIVYLASRRRRKHAD